MSAARTACSRVAATGRATSSRKRSTASIGVLRRGTVHPPCHVDDLGHVDDGDPQRLDATEGVGDLAGRRLVEQQIDHRPRVEDYSS